MKTKAQKADAVSSGKSEVSWHQINWNKAHQHVRRVQLRIAKATREGKLRKAKSLQRLLTHSFHAKALAVKRVTENQGKQRQVSTAKLGQLPKPNHKPFRRSKGRVIIPSR
jgi:RNA-directed DNA polymerase